MWSRELFFRIQWFAFTDFDSKINELNHSLIDSKAKQINSRQYRKRKLMLKYTKIWNVYEDLESIWRSEKYMKIWKVFEDLKNIWRSEKYIKFWKVHKVLKSIWRSKKKYEDLKNKRRSEMYMYNVYVDMETLKRSAKFVKFRKRHHTFPDEGAKD